MAAAAVVATTVAAEVEEEITVMTAVSPLPMIDVHLTVTDRGQAVDTMNHVEAVEVEGTMSHREEIMMRNGVVGMVVAVMSMALLLGAVAVEAAGHPLVAIETTMIVVRGLVADGIRSTRCLATCLIRDTGGLLELGDLFTGVGSPGMRPVRMFSHESTLSGGRGVIDL
ncbi:hypothetical protein AA313_de0201649 [Arthrobotrys entomopaga]|nr:hypothetical protein AA313_de0201649 [Arthrobotrys entomopaga]